MRDVTEWPKLVADEDRVRVCEEQIAEIIGDVSSFIRQAQGEDEILRKRIEALEARIPARSWVGALMVCLRAQRYGRHS